MYLKTSRDPCVRFGIGRFTSEEEVVFSFVMSTYDITKSHPQVKYTIERTVKEVSRLRDMSPLWDMVQVGFFLPTSLQYPTLFLQDGIDLKTIQWTQH